MPMNALALFIFVLLFVS